MCNQYHGNITILQLQPFNLVGPTLNLQIKNKQFILCSFHEVLNLRRAPLVVRQQYINALGEADLSHTNLFV